MRKLTAVIMAAILTLTLFACGKAAEAPASGAATAAETEAPSAEAVTAAAETPAATAAPETSKIPETTAAPETETPAPETEADLHEWDYGDRIEVSENGEVLTVRLPANATTGYFWSYKIWDEGSLELLTDEYLAAPHADGMVGTGGAWVASFRLTNERDGKNYINFYYSRGEMEIPDYVADINFNEGKLWVTGEHENELSLYEFEDGEFDNIELNFENMFEENELSFYAAADVISPVVFTDEEFAGIRTGDKFTGRMYGTDAEVTVTVLEKLGDDFWRINDEETISYSDYYGGWIITGLDDDTLYNVEKTISIHFTNETHIEDQMEAILQTGNSGTIYDKMHDYHGVNASLKVENGVASEITLFYHP